ncbi:hypothetical protein ACFX1X_026474 [Malus domestica]
MAAEKGLGKRSGNKKKMKVEELGRALGFARSSRPNPLFSCRVRKPASMGDIEGEGTKFIPIYFQNQFIDYVSICFAGISADSSPTQPGKPEIELEFIWVAG